jgi:phosphoserine phosphatase
MHDLDGTLIRNIRETSEEVMKQLLAQKRVSKRGFLSKLFADRFFNFLRYLKIFNVRIIKKKVEVRERLVEEYLKTIGKSLRGLTPEEVDLVMGAVADRLTITPGYKKLINELKSADLGESRKTLNVLATSQPSALAKKVGPKVGINPELCFGSEFEVGEDGKLTGEIKKVMSSRKKAAIFRNLREGGHFPHSIFDDSFTGSYYPGKEVDHIIKFKERGIMPKYMEGKTIRIKTLTPKSAHRVVEHLKMA